MSAVAVLFVAFALLGGLGGAACAATSWRLDLYFWHRGGPAPSYSDQLEAEQRWKIRREPFLTPAMLALTFVAVIAFAIEHTADVGDLVIGQLDGQPLSAVVAYALAIPLAHRTIVEAIQAITETSARTTDHRIARLMEHAEADRQ